MAVGEELEAVQALIGGQRRKPRPEPRGRLQEAVAAAAAALSATVDELQDAACR